MTAGVWPNNLPHQFTSFVGRERERAQAAAALVGTHLLVLTGAGGAGKTRLALDVAAASAEKYPDGAWWVDLAPLTRDEQVGAALATVLGVRPLPGRSHVQSATGHLGDHRALVVLDNCEHVAGAAADLCEALLRGCPQVAVLATSRIPLRVPGETDWRVPSLSLPATDAPSDISQSDAGALFVERATKVVATFVLSDKNALQVARICREVDGIPLAIELAAALIRMLSVAQIADGLSDRFRLLTGGPHGALARQQTLRASVDWSYDLLSEPERILFRRLAAFVGGWSLEAVEAVCVGEALVAPAILDLLTSLVDKSLVIVEQPGRESRYRLLETVRQYAVERLTASGEDAALADRHLDYYVALAEQAAPWLHTPAVLQWIEALDLETANLEAATDHAIEHRPQQALQLTFPLTAWWRLRGQFGPGQRALGRALDATDPRPGPLRARALWSCGFLARFAGDVATAGSRSLEALEMAESVSDDWALAASLHMVGALRMMRAPLESQALFARALEHARRSDDPWLLLGVHVNSARCYLMSDNFAEAERARREGEALIGGIGAEAVSQLGSPAAWCAMARGDLEQSAAICERTALAASTLGDPVSHGLADMVGAWVELLQGRAESALDRMQACESRAIAKGAFIVIPTTRIDLARALAALGRTDEARELLEVVVASGADGGWYYCRGLLALSGVLRAVGDTEASEARAAEALELSEQFGIRSHAAGARELLAQLRIRNGEWSAAEALLHNALEQRVDIGSAVSLSPVLDGLAQVAAGLESHTEATRLLGTADRARADLGLARWPLDAPAMVELQQALRGTLGADAFAVAYAEGTAMTVDQAVAWVRRARGSRRRPSGGWESLTPTELRVIELLVGGLTNPQIGELMFISRATVKTHLGHIFEKLEVGSRSELTAMAVRRTP